jgi:hypothetical protein
MVITVEIGVWCRHTQSSTVIMKTGNHGKPAMTQITHTRRSRNQLQSRVCCHMVITIEIGVWCQHTPSSTVTMETGNHGKPAVTQITHTRRSETQLQSSVCCRMVITIETGVWCQHTPSSTVTMETGSHGKPVVTQITHTRVLNIQRCFRQEISSQECDESEYFLARKVRSRRYFDRHGTTVQKSMVDAARHPVIKMPSLYSVDPKSSSEFKTVTTGWRNFQLYAILAKQTAMQPSPSLYLKQTLRDICILAFTKWNTSALYIKSKFLVYFRQHSTFSIIIPLAPNT